MATTLVTTLKESVTDTSLLKLGEMKIKIVGRNDGTGRVCFGFNCGNAQGSCVLTILGDEYFTDSTATNNLGKVYTFASMPSTTNVYIRDLGEPISVVISNKYQIAALIADGCDIYINDESIDGMNFALDLTFRLVGDISHFRDNIRLRRLYLNNADQTCYGDISVFSDKSNMLKLNLREAQTIYGDISSVGSTIIEDLELRSSGITGSLSSLADKTALSTLLLQNSRVTGNLSSLTSLTSLRILNLNYSSQVEGDTSSLAGLSNLTTFSYVGCPNITGTWPLT